MPSLLLIVFVLQVVVHVINSVGGAAINELLWTLYNKLPTSSTSATVAKADALRREAINLKRELNATSAQDDFARWAKLRRQSDKTNADYEKLSQSLQTTKTTFDSRVSSARVVLTNVVRLVLQYWYSRTPMFWIPKGWAPYYAEWLLSWPRAPIGSLSIQMWFIACGRVIAVVSEAVVAAYVLVMKGVAEKRLQRAKDKVASEKKTTS